LAIAACQLNAGHIEVRLILLHTSVLSQLLLIFMLHQPLIQIHSAQKKKKKWKIQML
jgi:hypothetical protein